MNVILEIDKSFLSKLVIEGKAGLLKIKEHGVKDTFVDDNYAEAYRYITSYIDKYDTGPLLEDVEFKTNIKLLTECDVPFDFLIDELFKRQLYNVMGEGLKEAVKHMQDRKPDEAWKEIEKLQLSVRQSELLRLNTIELSSLKDMVAEMYYKAKAGVMGIETPWPTITNATMGWQKGAIYGFFARTGKGKSQISVAVARHAWLNKKKVLFVSPEMTKAAIARRFFGMEFKVSAERLRKGQLGDLVEPGFFKRLNELRSDTPIYILADEWRMDLGMVEAAIEKHIPDLIIIDGIYLLECPGDTIIDRMGNMADLLKGIERRYQIPLIITSQFNRTVKQNASRAELTSIALSDRLSWCLDVCIGLIQDDELKEERCIKMIPLKLREAEDFEELLINFNFETQDFTEIKGLPSVETTPAATTSAGAGPDMQMIDDRKEEDPF